MRRAAATCFLALVAGASLGGEEATARRAGSGPHRVSCGHLRGHTILRHGAVRVFRASGTVYGCLDGRAKAWQLWETESLVTQAKGGAVEQVAGRFLAFGRISSSQYGFSNSSEVVNLASGATYTIGLLVGEEGNLTASPPSPGPQPLEAFRLGPDGRTLRLYATFRASAKPVSNAAPSGQVLEVIGFHGYHRPLVSCGPGQIARGSLTYNGRTIGWKQNGVEHSAGA